MALLLLALPARRAARRRKIPVAPVSDTIF